jgi:EAL and modified HD-GYP domain-containing signal transduction protein
MSQVFVARQPIFDRRLKVTGYELLFRDGPGERAVVLDSEGATAKVVLRALTEIGWERIVGPHKAWINVSREFLLSGLVKAVPPSLVGFEILENELIDETLVEAVRDLKTQGYRIALDDFTYSAQAEPLLPLVDVVKLDVLALDPAQLAEHMARLRRYDVKVLGEKVESRADHDRCADADCDLFQGFFFCRPELLSDRQIDAHRMALLQLIEALQKPLIEIAELEQLIARDVALSFRLLRYINSAFFALRYEISSIRQAIALLGVDNLKRWATLTIFASVDEKPSELTVTALVRARFCELAGARAQSAPSAELFTLGLFSVIDALMDVPMEDALASIPFPHEMRDALISRDGPLGRLLESVTALEVGEFSRAEFLVRGASGLHLEAIIWANDAADPLFDELAAAA